MKIQEYFAIKFNEERRTTQKEGKSADENRFEILPQKI